MKTTREDNNTNIRQILLETYKSKSIVFSWLALEETILEVELTISKLQMDKNEITLEFFQDHLSSVQQMISGSGKMNFYLPEIAMVFVADYKNLNEDENRLTISLPKAHALYDRRDAKRVKPSETIWISFDIKGKKIRKKCIDLSEGGASIIFSKMENIPSLSNESIQEMVLSCEDKEIKLKGRVVESIKLSPFFLEDFPYGGVRLSISFEGDSIFLKKFLEQV